MKSLAKLFRLCLTALACLALVVPSLAVEFDPPTVPTLAAETAAPARVAAKPKTQQPAAKVAAACPVCGPQCPCGPGVNCGALNCPHRLPSLPAFCGPGGCQPATCGPNGCAVNSVTYGPVNRGRASCGPSGCVGGACNQPPANYYSRPWLPQRPLLFRFRGRCRGCR